MKIALLQVPLIWENPTANLKYFENVFESSTETIDLLVLPEMFTSGFTMQPELIFDTMEGSAITWLKKWAKKKKCAITGSLVIKEKNKYYNRLVWVAPSGKLSFYDKRHLFGLAGENKVYVAGNNKLIINYKGFKICPLICYDLRFPVFSRNIDSYDVLLYVANWPTTRINAWDILLKARAIENMCYTIGVNRVGTDGKGHEYNGHSQAVDSLGDYVLAPQETEGVYLITLNKELLLESREKLPFLKDKDAFDLS